MKTTIENSVIFLENQSNEEMLIAFNELIQSCTLAENEYDLKNRINCKSFFIDDYFKTGFGAHHFWVKQKNVNCDARILFVEF